jgi:antitoxin MazE
MLRSDEPVRIYYVDTTPTFNRRISAMVTTVQRWGNSLAVRIPKPFAAEAQLSEDSDVDISVEQGRIVITPAKRDWNLAKLLKQISPSNLHREVEWGDSRGKEIW